MTEFAPPEVPLPEPLDAAGRLLGEVLSVLRKHLGMDVAFLSRVSDDVRTFEYVDADPSFRPFEPGDSDPAQASYCARVIGGRIPQLIPDATVEPGVADLGVTRDLPIGAHLSVPVRTAGGEPYGTLCCFSRAPRTDLPQGVMHTLHMFAEVIGKHLDPVVARRRGTNAARERITRVLDHGALRIALQPIVEVATGAVAGYEALARFPENVGWAPDLWFDAAHKVGLGAELEAAAIGAALALLPRIPSTATLAVNASARAVTQCGSICNLLAASPARARLVLELTERDLVGSPGHLHSVLRDLRADGVRIAVDDAGSGYSGLERILTLRPDVLKLDRALVHGIADHAGRRAMCAAMVGFGEHTGTALIAEGVERPEDLEALRDLDVSHAQGYLLGVPTILTADSRVDA